MQYILIVLHYEEFVAEEGYGLGRKGDGGAMQVGGVLHLQVVLVELHELALVRDLVVLLVLFQPTLDVLEAQALPSTVVLGEGGRGAE